jgi:integrase
MAAIMYGSGLRLMECCTLRVKDIDMQRNTIVVRDGKGQKDRITMVPARLRSSLLAHLARQRKQFEQTAFDKREHIRLPSALARKYPSASREWPWRWVFPATRTYVDAEDRRRYRHHLHETVVQRAVRQAACRARISKPVRSHLASLFRDPPARARLRHSHDPGAARAQRHQHHHDLHARTQPRADRSKESSR